MAPQFCDGLLGSDINVGRFLGVFGISYRPLHVDAQQEQRDKTPYQTSSSFSTSKLDRR